MNSDKDTLNQYNFNVNQYVQSLEMIHSQTTNPTMNVIQTLHEQSTPCEHLPSIPNMPIESVLCRTATTTTTTVVTTTNTIPVNPHASSTITTQSQELITSHFSKEEATGSRNKQRIREASKISIGKQHSEYKNKRSKLDPELRINSDNIPDETHVIINVPTNNKFALLENPDMEVEVMDRPSTSQTNIQCQTNDTQSTNKTEKLKIPPITLKLGQLPQDFFKFNRDIQRKLKNPLKIAYSYDGIKYFTSHPTDYDILYKYFKDQELPFYTHEINKQKTIQVVLKRLPSTVTPSMIEEELVLLGFNVIHIRQMTKQKMQADGSIIKQPLSAWVITLPYNEKSTKIYKLKDLNNHIITIERYINSPHVIQCHRCQAVGHTATHCHMPLRCVKCGEAHSFNNCDKKGDQYTPSCANCNGQHTATYGQCTYIQRCKTQIEQKLAKKSYERLNQPTKSTDNMHLTSMDFPELTRPTKLQQPQTLYSNKNTNTNYSIREIVQELKTLFGGINIPHTMATIRTTAEKLKTAPDIWTKLTALIDGVCTIVDTFLK